VFYYALGSNPLSVLMAKNMRDAATASKNWSDRTSGADTFWLSQIQSSSWKSYAASDAAETNFNKTMTKVLSSKSHQAGINKSSDEKWKGGAASKGKDRFGPGVTAAKDKMNSVMTKLLPDIKSKVASLPARGPPGDPGNYDRSKQLGQALHDKKGSYKA